jgi:MarR family 2-MHQ and catechol resistance regulon transcriptional repressor
MASVSDNPDPMITVILSRAYRSIAEFLESGLVMHGIPWSDFVIVEVLLHKEPLQISEIAQKSACDKGCCEENCDSAEKSWAGEVSWRNVRID